MDDTRMKVIKVIETRSTVYERTRYKIVIQARQGIPGPPGPPGTGSGDMQKLIYDPHGFEIDVFDLGHMTGTLDAGTF
jgi:hypothetical protein